MKKEKPVKNEASFNLDMQASNKCDGSKLMIQIPSFCLRDLS